MDQRALRDVLGAFVTGVTVVTTIDAEGRPYGVTANSFSSVSLNPPLVLWSQALSAKSFPVFRDSDHFVINILAHDQIELSRRFSVSGEDKFGGLAVQTNAVGVPVLHGCTAFLECRKIATYPGGDHAVFLGEVQRFRRTDSRPLAFGGGKYMTAHVHDLGSVSNDPQAATLDALQALQLIHQAMPGIAANLGSLVGLGVWGNMGPTVIRWEPSATPITSDLHTGVVVSPIDSATGLAFSAHLPAPITSLLIHAELARQGDLQRTMVTLQARLEAIRERGLAHSVPQRLPNHIAAISVPVFDHRGSMVAALTMVEAMERLNAGENGPREQALQAEARKLSHRLGWVPGSALAVG